MPHQERVNIAVFIDFDNIEIGVKSTLGEHFDIGIILEALRERGEVVTKIAYADWTRASEYSRALTQHAIRLVQRNLTPGGDKNGADINLALDALEMAFTHPHINAYVIVGGDSDFLSLVEKLKQYDKKVFVVGGRAFTSIILQRNCHEFIAYENLVRKPAAKGGRPAAPAASSPIAQAFPIVRRALKILADREVSPQTGLLKSTLLQLDSTFSERNYGAASFLDFVERLAQAGLVQLKHSGRSVMVELNAGFAEDADSAGLKARTTTEGESPESAPTSVVPAFGSPHEHPGDERPAPAASVPAGDGAEGVRLAGQILGAVSNARWPMYLRNVKQTLRAAGGFDEHRYGFGGLMDLLRACQREGLIRLERDRRGGLRVFQGSVPPGATPRADAAEERTPEIVEVVPDEATGTDETARPDLIEAEPAAVVDTTAELLGGAKPRRPRALSSTLRSPQGHPELGRGTTGSGQRQTVARKPAATRRVSRATKTAAEPRNESGTRG